MSKARRLRDAKKKKKTFQHNRCSLSLHNPPRCASRLRDTTLNTPRRNLQWACVLMNKDVRGWQCSDWEWAAYRANALNWYGGHNPHTPTAIGEWKIHGILGSDGLIDSSRSSNWSWWAERGCVLTCPLLNVFQVISPHANQLIRCLKTAPFSTHLPYFAWRTACLKRTLVN